MTCLTYLLLALFALLTHLEPPAPTPLVAGQVEEQQAAAAEQTPEQNNPPADDNMPLVDQPKADEGNRPDESKSQEDYDRATDKWWAWFNPTAVTIFTFVLMLTTLFQLFVMRHEMKATRDAAKAAIDTVEHMRLEQRAWLVCRLPMFTPEIDKSDGSIPIIMSGIVHNVGRTPATVLHQLCACHIDTEEATAEVIDNIPELARRHTPKQSIVAPDSTITYITDLIREPSDHAKLATAKVGGPLKFFVVSYVAYNDVFGVRHATCACFVYHPESKTMRQHGSWNKME